MKKFVSILILAFCVLGMSAQNVVMKVKVNGTQFAEKEDGKKIELSGVLTLPKDAFSEISFFEKSLQIEAGTPEVNRTNVTIPLKFEGEPLSDITRWGIRYALSEDKLENDYAENPTIDNGSPTSKETSYFVRGLKANTTYYGQAFALFNDEIILSNVVSFTTGAADNDSIPIADAIDLGLPSRTKWANWNLGASEPKDTGRYCGWGDKNAYWQEISTAHYADGLDFETIAANPKYDPATYQWGDQWRMPTKADFKELYDYCTLGFNSENGKDYIIFTSKINGKSIFIPWAGYKVSTTHKIDKSLNFYWLAETDPEQPTNPLSILVEASNYLESRVTGQARFNLFQIRPVYGPVVDGGTDDPTPDDPPVVDNDGWKKLDHYVYDDDGNQITAVPQDGVDMGLPSGTKWAAWNVGALPFDKKGNIDYGIKGRYYAWGNINEHEEYSKQNYQEETQLWGVQQRVLKSEDDIATVLWGEDWQIPSRSDFYELFELQEDGSYTYVTVEWKQIKKGDSNNAPVYGYKVTSKKNPNNFIYLQATGLKHSKVADEYSGYYWTNNGAPSPVYSGTFSDYLYFNSIDEPNVDSYERYIGMQVRPVKYKK